MLLRITSNGKGQHRDAISYFGIIPLVDYPLDHCIRLAYIWITYNGKVKRRDALVSEQVLMA